jgi:hypothetical protein
MQIPILNGVFSSQSADLRQSYPVNLMPSVLDSGISAGFLRPAEGIVNFGTGPGIDRGAFNWNDVCYRIMGTKLVSISNTGIDTILGDVGAGGQVTMHNSFDRLAINSGTNLYYWNGSTLTQVTDPDLGFVIDMVWVDGYFMTTDGENIVVTELNDPTAVNPLKYGSSEADPDPVKRLLKINNEVYALNRYTIEVFDNIGGDLFPFHRIEGAQIDKGAIGSRGSEVFVGSIAFLGSSRKEAPAIYLGLSGQVAKISSPEIDTLLKEYSVTDLEAAVMEVRIDEGRNLLYLHLPDRAIVYDYESSKNLGQPVWFYLTSDDDGFSEYQGRNFLWCYDKWLCGDPTSTNHGYLTDTISDHYGVAVRWEFGTKIFYNEGRDSIVHELELVALTGRVAIGKDPSITTSFSEDGENWSTARSIKAGINGKTKKRLMWLQNGVITNYRMQRFRGNSDSFLSFIRLEAKIEGLNP